LAAATTVQQRREARLSEGMAAHIVSGNNVVTLPWLVAVDNSCCCLESGDIDINGGNHFWIAMTNDTWQATIIQWLPQ